jgi:hypothetical protein
MRHTEVWLGTTMSSVKTRQTAAANRRPAENNLQSRRFKNEMRM